ncbi:methyltransferase domain-containing protein [Bradyrhizobium sp. 138]|uniref:class I SAM-dependent methyltransferase n=1 Tax=Bradyrhizobium sp. 138 TaxID=2782615 RepID=UPI001FF8E01A|nr:class I SAM-dependent methyltransferase [Bradyrhizobium sp. 138]MCK1737082.1 methyltransferase domain-containing protein [Bradyrhizobium sp. 138]
MIPACPICATKRNSVLDQRERVPVLQNRVWPDRASALSAPAGRLDMRLCANCNFAWNAAFDPKLMVYDSFYDNNQLVSEVFSDHVDAMVQRIITSLDESAEAHLVEIGCGQGDLLRRLARANRFASLTGFDPAFKNALEGHDANMTIHTCLFDNDTLNLLRHPIDIIVARHTIEHIHRPLDFLRTIRAAVDATRPTKIFLETPDINWIVENFQHQDLFYEHCSIFSKRAMHFGCQAAGFNLCAITSVFSDQYLWAEIDTGDSQLIAEPTAPSLLTADGFRAKRLDFVERWRDQIVTLGKEGRVWLWGASSKGVTFALLVDPDGELLAGAIDINPKKVGQFMPLTGVQVCDPTQLESGDSVIVMNPNYLAEISNRIASQQKSIRLLTLDTAHLEMSA